MKTWLKILSSMMAVAMLIAFFIADNSVATPEQCPICTHAACHAPCLLNLATGEIDELALYPPEIVSSGSIRPEYRTGGTFSFFSAAGCQGIKLADPWYIEIKIPVAGELIDRSRFCKLCQELLETCNRGYVLIDLYDEDAPRVYPITADKIYELRCYAVSVASGGAEMILRIDGLIE